MKKGGILKSPWPFFTPDEEDGEFEFAVGSTEVLTELSSENEATKETYEEDSISLSSVPSLRFEPVEEHKPGASGSIMQLRWLLIIFYI